MNETQWNRYNSFISKANATATKQERTAWNEVQWRLRTLHDRLRDVSHWPSISEGNHGAEITDIVRQLEEVCYRTPFVEG